jgi:hypothetical protein
MQSPENFTEVTFYYQNGETEAYELPVAPESFAQQLQGLLNQPWLTLHLFDKTTLIRTAQVNKVEVKPAVPQLQGQGVFPEVQRVTALNRAGRV